MGNSSRRNTGADDRFYVIKIPKRLVRAACATLRFLALTGGGVGGVVTLVQHVSF